MHLLALGAFWPRASAYMWGAWRGLNAPFGALCFLTELLPILTLSSTSRLNAPFGAWCFLTAMPAIFAKLVVLLS